MEILDALWAKLLGVPSAFWAAFLGASGPLVGVILTNRGHERRQRGQFTHERILKNQDRDAALKKEILLDAVEAMHAASLMIARCANLDIGIEELQRGYIDKSPAMAKLHLISDEKISSTAAELSVFMANAMTVALMKRARLSAIRIEIDTLQKSNDQFLQKNDSAFDAFNTQLAGGNLNGSHVYKNVVDAGAAIISANAGRMQQLSDDLLSKSILLSEECAGVSIEFSNRAIDLLVAMRTELGIETSDGFIANLRALGNRQKEAVQKIAEESALLRTDLMTDSRGASP